MDDGDRVNCHNCKRDIPGATFDLHILHCVKNIKLCTFCDDAIPIREYEEHISEEHAEIQCPDCKIKFRQGDESLHQRVCTMARMKCEYCDLDFPRRDIDQHINECGSRTDTCDQCNERLMLKDLMTHVCKPMSLPRNNLTTIDSRTSTSPYALQPLRNQLQSHNVGADYLDELIATEHFNPLNGSAVDLDAALATQIAFDEQKQSNVASSQPPTRSPARPRSNGDCELKLPCEFCEQPFLIDDLILHQSGCVQNPITPVIPNIEPEVPLQFPVSEFHDSYIPCEFCCKQFPLSFISQHQAGCTPTRRVASYTTNTRPAVIDPPSTRTQRQIAPSRRTAPSSNNEDEVEIEDFRTTTNKQKMNPRPLAEPQLKKKEPSKPGRNLISKKVTGGKEPVKFKNTKTANSENMNDLGKLSTSKMIPTVIVPKRRAGKNVGRAGSSTSDNNNGVDTWSSSNIGQSNGSTTRSRKTLNNETAPSTSSSSSQNNFNHLVRSKKAVPKGKDIKINVSNVDNQRTRQNILNKYQKDKTSFVVTNSRSNSKSDETSGS